MSEQLELPKAERACFEVMKLSDTIELDVANLRAILSMSEWTGPNFKRMAVAIDDVERHIKLVRFYAEPIVSGK